MASLKTRLLPGGDTSGAHYLHGLMFYFVMFKLVINMRSTLSEYTQQF